MIVAEERIVGPHVFSQEASNGIDVVQGRVGLAIFGDQSIGFARLMPDLEAAARWRYRDKENGLLRMGFTDELHNVLIEL